MKSRITLLMSVLVMLTFVLTGCRKSDYVNVIPSDATAVAAVDIKSIIEKCGMTDSENTRIKEVLTDAVRGGLSAETQKQVEEIIASPAETGIDFASPAYLFAVPEVSDPVLLLKVSDSDKLKSLLETFAKENICQQLGEESGYTFTVIGRNLVMLSNSALVAVGFNGHSGYEELKDKLAAMLGQDSDKSIAGQKIFDKMSSRKDDIKFFASMDILPKELLQQSKMLMPGDFDTKDVSVVGGLNFGKGEIALQYSNYTENSQVADMIKKQSKAAETIDRDYVGYFPKATMLFASMGINGKKYYEVLTENNEVADAIPFLTTDTGKDVISSVDGDISVGITGVGMDGTPTFLAYAKVKNNSILEAIYNGKDFFLSGKQSIEKKGKNEYVYKEGNQTVYFGMKKKNFYATNDKALYDNLCSDAKPSLSDAEFAGDIKGKTAFVVVDVKSILALPIVKMLTGMGNAETQMYVNLASKIDYLELNGNEDGVANLRMVLADQNTNSLRQIVTLISQFVGLQ